MRFHIEQSANASLLALRDRAQLLVQLLPEVDLGPERPGSERRIPVSCHMVTRALAPFLTGTKVVDGYFRRPNEHSWLKTGSDDWILDVYPHSVVGGPLLVYVGAFSLWKDLYLPAPLHTIGTTLFVAQTQKVFDAMQASASAASGIW